MPKFTGKVPYAKPATPVLCGPALSKCTWTCQKRHFAPKFTGKMPDTNHWGKHFVRACAVEMHMDVSQEALCAEIYRKSAVRQARDSRFVRACAVEMHMDMSEEAFCAEIYTENAGR